MSAEVISQKQFLDPHTLFIAVIGPGGMTLAQFDSWVTRIIALLTLAILAHRFWVVFFRRRKD